MKDITSLEKSKALKAAGVLPPPVEVGQVWYDIAENAAYTVFYVSKEELLNKVWYESLNMALGYTDHGKTQDQIILKRVYAFNPSDLLLLLPPDTTVGLLGEGLFVVNVRRGDPVHHYVCSGEKLADVLADALLIIKNEQNG